MDTLPREGILVVGTTPVLLGDQQPGRQMFSIRQTSDAGQLIQINRGIQKNFGSGGILLIPNNIGSGLPGEYYQESSTEGSPCFEGQIWLIAGAAGATVTYSVL